MSVVLQGNAVRRALEGLPDKARTREGGGLWSFLTRAFMVIPFVAAEHFVASPASATMSGEDSPTVNGKGAAEPMRLVGPGLTPGDLDSDGGAGYAGPARHLQEVAPSTVTLKPFAPSHYDSIDKFSELAGKSHHGVKASDGGTLQVAHEEAPSVVGGMAGSDHSSSNGGPDDGLGNIGRDLIDNVVTPILNTVVDALPLGVLDTVVDTLTGVVRPLATTVDNLVEALPLGSLDTAVDTLVTRVVNPLTSIVEDLAEDLAAGPVGDAIGSAGQIVFDTMPAVEAVTDTLFSNGRYTDYNLALRSSGDGADAANLGGAVGGVASALVETLLASDQDHQSSGHQQAITLPSVLDDVAHRGIGDIIS